jgi:8-amino-7-oxononanoate synthase
MLDFTSALYLGLHHPNPSLRPWVQLTTGVPTALRSTPEHTQLAHALATLQGCEHATLGVSTLHLFCDFFALLHPHKDVVLLDAGVYAIARWAAERAVGKGIAVDKIKHYDSAALKRSLERWALHGRRPLVVADAFCPTCGLAAPVGEYVKLVRAYGGDLVLDDTQALGILGHSRSQESPFGKDGGGSLQWHGVYGPDVMVISSLAKGFGTPMAVLAGGRSAVKWYEDHGETRVHCSPVSMASIRAAQHALAVNAQHGDSCRWHLLRLIRLFRAELEAMGHRPYGSVFPVQRLYLQDRPGKQLYAHLLRHGIRTVLHETSQPSAACLSIILTARHTERDVHYVINALKKAIDKPFYDWETDHGTTVRSRRAASTGGRRLWGVSPTGVLFQR